MSYPPWCSQISIWHGSTFQTVSLVPARFVYWKGGTLNWLVFTWKETPVTFIASWSHPQPNPLLDVLSINARLLMYQLFYAYIVLGILDIAPCKLTCKVKHFLNHVLFFSDITLMSSKTNNLANTNPIKHSGNTHHLQTSSGSTLPYWAESVSGSRVLDCTTLSIVVSLDPSSPLNLYWNGHICCNGSEAEIVFRPGLTESNCAVGALASDVISRCPESECPLGSWLLSSYAMPQVAERREAEAGESVWWERAENQRSIICQGLGNDYTMAALSHFLLLQFFSPLFCQSWVLCCLSYYMSSSSKLFDQVVWPTTHSRHIVNVSMCLLLYIVLTLLKRINGPVMKLAVRWLIHFSTNLEMRPIGRETLTKQNVLCFYPHY